MLVGIFALSIVASAAEATYPAEPVTIIIPFSPGGGGDIWMRVVTSVAANYFEVPVRAINIAGSGGAIGVRKGLAEPADGYTIISITQSNVLTSLLHTGVGYTWRDLRPFIQLTEEAILLSVRKDAPWQTWKELQQAHQHPVPVNGRMPVKTPIKCRMKHSRRLHFTRVVHDVARFVGILSLNAVQGELGETRGRILIQLQRCKRILTGHLSLGSLPGIPVTSDEYDDECTYHYAA